MRRRPVLAVAAGVLAALVLATPAWADVESISTGSWAGSALDAGPASMPISSYQLSGTFRRSGISRQVEVTLATDPPRGGPCTVTPVAAPVGNTPLPFSLTVSIPCNGTYKLIATATTKDDNAVLPADSAELTRTVDVISPAPAVTGLNITVHRRLVNLTWDDMVGAAPDVTGYLVERQIDNGAYERIARLSVGTEAFADNALPAAGGNATYRVRSTRPSPNGEQVSTAAQTKSVSFIPAPTSTGGAGGTGGTTGGSTTGSGDGTTAGGTSGGTTGGSNGSTTGGAPNRGGSGGSGTGITAPRLFSGTFLPPLLRPASETVRPDSGYSGVLPYGPRGQSEAVAGPEDDFSAIGSDGGEPRRGMVVPVATALVLAIWAFHLRMLARAARPL